jgi:hypothetical protein
MVFIFYIFVLIYSGLQIYIIKIQRYIEKIQTDNKKNKTKQNKVKKR